MTESNTTRKALILIRKAPYGTFYNFEGLQTMLIMSAYELDLSVGFMDDGVTAIVRGQDTGLLGATNLGKRFRALPDFEVTRFYIHKESLEERGLTASDLLLESDEEEDVRVEVIDSAAFGRLFERQDAILPF